MAQAPRSTDRPPSRRPTGWRALFVALAIGLALWITSDREPDAPVPAPSTVSTPAPAPAPSPSPSALPDNPAKWPIGTRDVPYAATSERGIGIHGTLDLIEMGGPYPYWQDGQTFQNRERRLPQADYLEFTVPTPGESDRGARRLVVNAANGVVWYSDDHYETFVAVARVRLPP